MPNVTAEDITLINFGMGSANAATVMDLLAIQPNAVLFLGKCGGLKKKNNIGDLILPIAAIRGDGTSTTTFRQKYRLCQLSTCKRRFRPPSATWSGITGTGTVYTTNRRVWEHDEQFKKYLRSIRAMAVDMETATLFSVGFITKSRPGRCCWFQTNRWRQMASKQPKAIKKSPRNTWIFI